MSRHRGIRARSWALASAATLAATAVAVSPAVVTPAWGVASTGLVVNEVYGGGGNAGSLWTTDFIELTNRSADPVPVAGWSVQYHSASATGAWQVTPLTGEIAPGQLFLIAQATGSGGT